MAGSSGARFARNSSGHSDSVGNGFGDRIDPLRRQEPSRPIIVTRKLAGVNLPDRFGGVGDAYNPFIHIRPNDVPAQTDLDAAIGNSAAVHGSFRIPLHMDP